MGTSLCGFQSCNTNFMLTTLKKSNKLKNKFVNNTNFVITKNDTYYKYASNILLTKIYYFNKRIHSNANKINELEIKFDQ